MKKCKWCGRTFEPNYGNQKYCSVECRNQAQRSKYDNEYYREYYRNHREAVKKSRKKYYAANQDRIREHNRNYYWQNKEHYRDYDHQRKSNFHKRLNQCCKEHGGVDNCPYPDCIRN